MTKDQTRWWNAVKKKELDSPSEKIFSGGAALVKLQQIEGGFWKWPDRIERLARLEQNPKMLILLDEITWYDGQVIVWSEYLHEIDAQAEFLRESGISAGVFTGRATGRDRDLAAFKSGRLRVLLAQPRAGGEGRDMSAAGKIIWFSHTPDAIVRSQADERATKMGGDTVQIVDMIAPVGKYFLELTRQKRTLADDVGRNGLRKILEQLQ
jgi:hypothetical protein